MSLVDDFLNNSHAEVDATIGTKSMVCDGQTFEVVWDDFRSEDDSTLGGLESQITAMATAQPSAVTAPLSLKGKRCTVGDEPFRVQAVRIGAVAIRFDLCSPEEGK